MLGVFAPPEASPTLRESSLCEYAFALMAEKRRNYDRQFKVDAVALLESSGRQVQEIEAELGIGQGCLSRWRKELAEQGSPVEQAEKQEEKERMRQLERELRIVRQERDILKKALAIFSQTNE